MKNLLLAGLFLLALLAGCSKRKYETSVFGYVVEKSGSRKLAGAKVYLVEDHHGTYNVTQTYHDSTISGPDGHYSFKFNYGEGEFRVIAEAENYYPVTTPPPQQGFLSSQTRPIPILQYRVVGLCLAEAATD